MHFAHERGVPWLTIEPMSCLAEPPTVPEEIRQMADELADWHAAHPDTTAQVGYCTDIAHGYADEQGTICHDHLELLEATLPHLYELHLKNTDERYSSTFGFSAADRQRGIVQIEPVRELLLDRAASLPVHEVVGYLEIGGPKLGRDYSDQGLAQQLRESLAYLKEVWPTEAPPAEAPLARPPGRRATGAGRATGPRRAFGHVRRPGPYRDGRSPPGSRPGRHAAPRRGRRPLRAQPAARARRDPPPAGD